MNFDDQDFNGVLLFAHAITFSILTMAINIWLIMQ